MGEFKLDTSGVVYIERTYAGPHGKSETSAYAQPVMWSDLSPFAQGYMAEALKPTASQDALGWFAYVGGCMLRDKRGVGRRFDSEDAALKAATVAYHMLATETLARIIEDCETVTRLRGGQSLASIGRSFWENRQAGRLVNMGFSPLTFSLGDDGKARLS